MTAGLVTAVVVVASVVAPASPPSIAELGPSAQDRIEEARDDQGIGSGDGVGGSCAPEDVGCVESSANDPAAGTGSDSGIPPALQVAAGRRCFGDPPRQTEDPHSPPCVFEIFKGDNGGATAQGVTAAEIRIAVPMESASDPDEEQIIEEQKEMVEAYVAHFNYRYEFYGRRLTPIFVSQNGDPRRDPSANGALAEALMATKPFGAVSWHNYAINAEIYRRLSEGGVVSVVSRAPGFDSDAVVDGWTWLVDPPLDVRLRSGAQFACRGLVDRLARHAGPGSEGKPRRFAVVVLTEPGARPDPGPLQTGLRACGADFDDFEASFNGSPSEFETLMLELKAGDFTTVLTVSSDIQPTLFQSASKVGYFPEWMDLGIARAHMEGLWGGSGRQLTVGQATQAFGIVPTARIRPEAEAPATWALREGGGTGTAGAMDPWYESLLVLASGIQGAGPNLTPETFASALRTMEFPNPNPGAPPYWQQRVGFGPGDPLFHDDYAVWWWSEDAPSQTSGSSSGRGSFCYLGGGARFTTDAFPADADDRLFSASEPCR